MLDPLSSFLSLQPSLDAIFEVTLTTNSKIFSYVEEINEFVPSLLKWIDEIVVQLHSIKHPQAYLFPELRFLSDMLLSPIGLLDDLISEVSSDYRKIELRLILEKRVEKYSGWKKPEVKYDFYKIEAMQNYKEIQKKIHREILFARREVHDVLAKIIMLCNKASSMTLISHRLDKCLTPEQFNFLQLQTAAKTIKYLKGQWLEKIINTVKISFREVGKGAFNIRQTDPWVYDVVKLKRLVNLIVQHMQNLLVDLTIVPGTALLRKIVPRISVFGTTVFKTIVPGTAVLRTIVPGTAVLRTIVPGTAVLRTIVPGTALLRTIVPRISVLGTACRTTVPRISVLGTAVLKTIVSGTAVLRIIVPRTAVLRTIVPRISVPRTIVPGTAVLGTIVPGTSVQRKLPTALNTLIKSSIEKYQLLLVIPMLDPLSSFLSLQPSLDAIFEVTLTTNSRIFSYAEEINEFVPSLLKWIDEIVVQLHAIKHPQAYLFPELKFPPNMFLSPIGLLDDVIVDAKTSIESFYRPLIGKLIAYVDSYQMYLEILSLDVESYLR
ncbi:hypothetical protein KQX54_011827 [Cotesia glomerata]|uniref:Uncharacterized protein n=1 Tax=Cotesia glomerata TaxID=32391 RepID=A0AAV7IR42_COTGL|nr:hypothetical protein KQX54_011827 [Cotesia glomerata]